MSLPSPNTLKMIMAFWKNLEPRVIPLLMMGVAMWFSWSMLQDEKRESDMARKIEREITDAQIKSLRVQINDCHNYQKGVLLTKIEENTIMLQYQGDSFREMAEEIRRNRN